MIVCYRNRAQPIGFNRYLYVMKQLLTFAKETY